MSSCYHLTGREVGEMVMELKDHHSHDAFIKFNFNSIQLVYTAFTLNLLTLKCISKED